MIGGKGQKRHIACAFDGASQNPLVLGTCAGLTTRADLAPVGDELLQAIDVLVRNLGSLVPWAYGGAAGRVAAASPPSRAAVCASAAGASACITRGEAAPTTG